MILRSFERALDTEALTRRQRIAARLQAIAARCDVDPLGKRSYRTSADKRAAQAAFLSSYGSIFTEIYTLLHRMRIARDTVGRKIAKDLDEYSLGQEKSMITSSTTSDSTAMARVMQSNGISAANNQHSCRRKDGPDDTSGREPVGGRGGLMDAIKDAISGSATNSNAVKGDTTADPTGSKAAEALQSFMQTLLTALHSQGAASEPNAPAAKVADTETVSIRSRPRHDDFAADLQGLMQALTTPDSTDSKVGNLKSSFQNLLGALSGATNAGQSGATGDTSLGKFLQAFAAHVPGYSAVGNVVDTSA